MGKVAGVTGHRPDRITGYTSARMTALCIAVLERTQPVRVGLGMAMGWDMDMASACLWVGVPFVAYTVVDQTKRWPSNQKMAYDTLLEQAFDVIVTDGKSPKCYHDRNRKIVQDSDVILALWDGSERGGTWSTIEYAQQQSMKIINYWKSWEKGR